MQAPYSNGFLDVFAGDRHAASTCRRYELSEAPRRLKAFFRLDAMPQTFMKADVRPTNFAPIIRQQTGHLLATPAVWGLTLPGPKGSDRLEECFEVAAEAVTEHPALRAALKRRRCLVPVTAFHEYRLSPDDTPSEVLRFSHCNGVPLAIAGLWESWHLPGSNETVERFAIISALGRGKTQNGQSRLPVILDEVDWEIWLDPQINHLLLLQSLLHPCPEDWLIAEPPCC